MSWRLTERPRTMKVTKALAKEFAEMDTIPHDRPLSERRLQVYQRLMVAGQFRPVTWAVSSCKETGQSRIRLNGKHTSIMLSGMEVLPEFYVTIETYECDTLEDAAKLYATFDSKMMSRQATDIYLSFASIIPEFAAISDKILVLAAPAIAYHVLGYDGYQKSQPTERAEMLLEYSEFVIWLSEILTNGLEVGEKSKVRATHLRKMAVQAAMLATWQKSRAAATEFWAAVRDETGNPPSVADRKLAKFLCLIKMRGTGARKAEVTVTNRELYCKCLHAWNAWRKKESTALNYYADKPIPRVI